MAHMVGGVFEASDYPNFRRPHTLFAIKERPPRLRKVVCLADTRKAYRYSVITGLLRAIVMYPRWLSTLRPRTRRPCVDVLPDLRAWRKAVA